MWGFLITAWNWIVGAVSTTAAALASAAMAVASASWNAIKAAGHVISIFGHQAWGFLRETWDKVLEPAFTKVFHFTVTAFKDLWSKVLKPAWSKFNKWIDTAHDWLVTKFGPILCWLQKARKLITEFYKTYIRPWLDFIDVTRKFLKLLEALHIKWAAELDRKLAALEDKITRPFLLVVGKLNEIINLVNSVIDGFGLFQRVVLIRSLVRDYEFAWHAIVNPTQPVTDAEKAALNEGVEGRDVSVIREELYAYLDSGSGPKAARLDEAIQAAILASR
jgi:hypothetical protein